MKLQHADLAQLEEEASKIQAKLDKVMQQLPLHAKSVTGFSKFTNTTFSTSQRFIKAVNKSSTGIELVKNLPGPEGILRLAEGLRENSLTPDLSLALENTAEQLDHLIKIFAGSHSELKKILSMYPDNSKDVSLEEKTRALLFDQYQQVCGESIDHYVGFHCVNINSRHPEKISELILALRKNIQLAPGARPYSLMFTDSEKPIRLQKLDFKTSQELAPFSADAPSNTVLKDFSHPKIEQFYSGINRQGNAFIFSPQSDQLSNFDLACTHFDSQADHSPLAEKNSVNLCNINCRAPGKRLTLIVFLSKKLAKSCLVKTSCTPSSLKVHEFEHTPQEIWYEEIGSAPKLKLFDPVTTNLDKLLDVNYIESTISPCMDNLKQVREDYTGYLIDVNFPNWLTTYNIYFEYA